ncbi:MAG TPA: DUF2238 domain-containing protein [Microbacterium sp.]|uniref:DUF2238 domain-containing protein n=1 Tax=Microbacterium sp. TaxID=51671 RepID=UPI002B4774DB|nr:DUF2238 domain-containing protein [Microbacterium sp.]HKT55308.1 DUF2238 domain-containing protein [Microbacterium sp.]
MTGEASSVTVPWQRILREAVLLAMPFQVVFIVLTLALDAAHVPHVKPALALLLVPALWVPGAIGLLVRFPMPRMLQLHYFVFMSIGPYAGSALAVYGLIPGWDKVVHFDSGIMLAWLALWTLRESELRGGAVLRRWMSLVFVQLVAMSFAAAWEICEFIADHTIGTHAQLNNADTMGDIIGGTLGGLVSLLVVWWFRRPRSLLPPSLLKPAQR